MTWRTRVWSVVLFVTAALVGCDGSGTEEAGPDGFAVDAEVAPPDAEAPFPFGRCDERRMPLPPLVEDRTVYDQDELGVWTVNLTVSDLDGLADVNAGVEDAEIPVIFSEGSYGAGATEPNATLRIRGGMSRQNVQKNYKVELLDGEPKWRGQKEINLNKHMWDLTRIRNKMAFDLFETVPDLTSLRTQFVHMFVNGEDYGMYTWIEEADKRFLRSHGLDEDGQLYKAAGFEFQPVDPVILDDPEELRSIVEAKANRDDAKFLRMTEAVNDWSRDLGEVVDTYFDRDNLVTWLAVNVLLNNIDTRTQNFYLYSPSSCEGWYFLPWDYDGAWGFYGQLTEDDRERWERGLTNWWPVYLFQRLYTDPEIVAAIDDKVHELAATVLGDELTAKHIESYHDLVLPFISSYPDLPNLPGRPGDPAFAIELWEEELDRITPTVSRFLAEYEATFERPMPSHIAAQVAHPPYRFRWDDSHDLQGDVVSYDFQLSLTPQFAPADVVVEELDIFDDEIYVPFVPPGTYYWRVTIRDHQTDDSWQAPYDPYKIVTIE